MHNSPDCPPVGYLREAAVRFRRVMVILDRLEASYMHETAIANIQLLGLNARVLGQCTFTSSYHGRNFDLPGGPTLLITKHSGRVNNSFNRLWKVRFSFHNISKLPSPFKC